MNALTIGTSTINCKDGLYSLNDLHAASGGEEKNRPNYFIGLEQTKALTAEIENAGIPAFKSTKGRNGGTYVCRELVIAYAAWISAAFHLKVIRVFLSVVAPLGELITREQAGEIVTRMAERFPVGKDRPYAWSRFNNNFRLASYRDLPATKYSDALCYIASMEKKSTKLAEKLPELDVRRAMLSGLSLPKVPAPDSLEKAIKEKAISMAFEAYEISIEHLKRRIAFNCEYGMPIELDDKKAVELIKEITLGESLTHVYYARIGSLETAAYQALATAKEFMDDIRGIKSGDLKSGDLSGYRGEIELRQHGAIA